MGSILSGIANAAKAVGQGVVKAGKAYEAAENDPSDKALNTPANSTSKNEYANAPYSLARSVGGFVDSIKARRANNAAKSEDSLEENADAQAFSKSQA